MQEEDKINPKVEEASLRKCMLNDQVPENLGMVRSKKLYQAAQSDLTLRTSLYIFPNHLMIIILK